MTKTLEKFFEDLGFRESSGDYGVVNKEGFLGKYQMGEAALVDAGYYNRKVSGNYNNDWSGSFTGKDGVYSRSDFLSNHSAQEHAVIEYKRAQWKYLVNGGAKKYLGKVIKDVEITQSGLLGGAHLGGHSNVLLYLTSGGKIDKRDSNNVPISEYIRKFAGYDVSEITGLPNDADPSKRKNTSKSENKEETNKDNNSTDSDYNSNKKEQKPESENTESHQNGSYIWTIPETEDKNKDLLLKGGVSKDVSRDDVESENYEIEEEDNQESSENENLKSEKGNEENGNYYSKLRPKAVLDNDPEMPPIPMFEPESVRSEGKTDKKSDFEEMCKDDKLYKNQPENEKLNFNNNPGTTNQRIGNIGEGNDNSENFNPNITNYDKNNTNIPTGNAADLRDSGAEISENEVSENTELNSNYPAASNEEKSYNAEDLQGSADSTSKTINAGRNIPLSEWSSEVLDNGDKVYRTQYANPDYGFPVTWEIREKKKKYPPSYFELYEVVEDIVVSLLDDFIRFMGYDEVHKL